MTYQLEAVISQSVTEFLSSSSSPWSYSQLLLGVGDENGLGIGHLLAAVDLHRHPAEYFRLYSKGRRVDGAALRSSARYRRERLDFVSSEKLVDYLNWGYTIAVDHVELLLPRLHSVVDRAAGDSQSWIHVNAYLAGGNAQGLPAHSDSHDVLVLQVEGTRKWQVEDERGLTTLELTPNQILAIRRRTRHVAFHEGGSPSLHFALAVIRPRVAHLTLAALREGLAAHPQLNEEVPLLGSDAELKSFVERCGVVVQDLISKYASAGLDWEKVLSVDRDPWMEA